MLRLNKRIDYGILILSLLGSRQGEQVSATEISQSFSLSRHMVANILKSLAKAELVSAGRGVHGGYALARPADQIRLLDVIEALEGTFALLDCCGDMRSESCATTTALCTARPVMMRLNHRVRELLCEITVAAMAPGGPGASGGEAPCGASSAGDQGMEA